MSDQAFWHARAARRAGVNEDEEDYQNDDDQEPMNMAF